MALPPVFVKQTTNTTGTGTLTLNAAAADLRSFAAGFGAGTFAVRYILARSGVREEGYGTLTTAAGTLSRDVVTFSTNGGALVSLAAGTTDVYFDFLPGDRQLRTISANTTLDLADIGNVIRCTQSSDITITLPAAAAVPGGANRLSMGFMVRNAGSANSIVWIDPSGAETLDGSAQPFPLFVGETIELIALETTWMSVNKPTGWRFVGRSSAGASASVDFVLPAYPSVARSEYEFVFRQVRSATDGAFLQLRVDDAGGASFDAGGSDYQHGLIYVSGASAVSGNGGTADAIRLTTDIDSTAGGNQASGRIVFNPGASGARNPTVHGMSMVNGNGGIYAGPQPWIVGGQRLSAIDANAVRFMMNTGNVNLGDFDLFAKYD